MDKKILKAAKKAIKKVTKKAATKAVTILCQRCYTENPANAIRCRNCNSEKFAPEYIRRIEKINRNAFVQVTLPQDSFERRITLYKWWPGGKSSYNINNLEQWELIRNIIEVKLLPYLGWKSKEKILKEISTLEKKGENTEIHLQQLTKGYPELIRKVLKEVDFTKWESSNYQDLGEIVNEITELLAKTDAGYRKAFKDVITNLPKQQTKAVEDLSDLLKNWSLKQITAISHQVFDRLETLELFKDRVLDDKTYEIRGENSIHRILERAMWIIDERYWLMHSNETLRKVVVKELTENNKEFSNKRPDFVCGSVGNKLIIIELKRPSHELKLEDLNQLETYLSVIENHYDLKAYEAYLVGRKVSEELRKRMKYRGSQFKLMTFSDLIEDTEKRYKEFIDVLRNPDNDQFVSKSIKVKRFPAKKAIKQK